MSRDPFPALSGDLCFDTLTYRQTIPRLTVRPSGPGALSTEYTSELLLDSLGMTKILVGERGTDLGTPSEFSEDYQINCISLRRRFVKWIGGNVAKRDKYIGP